MIPVAFSGCRGWYHPATVNAGQRPGIVFFPAFGVEDLATRQSLLRLAEDLSAIGHPVLRFDLPGTGDAIGEMNEITSLTTWISAGREALASLAGLCGQQAPVLLGLRLGGLLACLVAAAERADGRPVAGLALLAPVLDGRRHLRELRTLANAETPLTVAGFPLPDALCAEITRIAPDSFAIAPAPDIFLALPGASASIEKLATGWQAEARVCRQTYDDLSGHIGNPTLSRTPATLFAAIRDWCPGLPAAVEGSAARQPVAGNTLAGPDWCEHAELLEIANGIATIWCQPQPPTPSADNAPLVVFCNAGRNPHHGWARGAVTLARRLAAEGIPSLRFDLPGLGDSPPPDNAPAELLYSEEAIPYLRAVIDAIEARNSAERPICVVGSCSGAHLAFHEAAADPRIGGLVLINIQRFVWIPGTSLVATMRSSGRSTSAYRQRALAPETWKRLFRGDIDIPGVLRPLLARTAESLRQKLPGGNGARNAIRGKMEALCRRGTRVTMIFSEDDGGRDEFARHFGASNQAFSRLACTRLVILPETDHDLTPPAARTRLLEEILILVRALR